MRDEISAAVLFLARLIEKGERFNREQLEHFKLHLSRLLLERCKDHWFPEKPDKGQGYRCIRVNGVFHDPIIRKAAKASGMKYEDIRLPYELTVWVDPNEVCCRFGENKGSFCTLASFNSKEPCSDTRTLISESNSVDEKDILIASPPPRLPLHCGNAERKRELSGGDIRSQNGFHQQRNGGWRHWSSPPRNYHSYNQHYHHWLHKSTLKV